MSSIRIPANWYWRGDNNWVPYSPALNKIIEDEYLKGNKKIKVDDERYIDLSCTKTDLKKKWYCVGSDEEFSIGLQRRYDSDYKRRAVKREIPTFLSGYTFALFLDDDTKEKYKDIILSLKGKVLQRLSSKIDMAIVDKDYIDDKIKSSILKNDIITVNISWLEDCIKQNKLLIDNDEIESYLVSLDGKKRKQRDELSIDEESSDNNKISIDINDYRPNKVQKFEDEQPDESQENSISLNNDFEQLDISKYEWEGVCFYQSENRLYPFILKFSHEEENTKFGTVTWPTLGNAISKFRGEILNDSFSFTEYEIVQGEEFISPSTKYNVKLIGKALEGELDENNGYSGSIYALPITHKSNNDDIFNF